LRSILEVLVDTSIIGHHYDGGKGIRMRNMRCRVRSKPVSVRSRELLNVHLSGSFSLSITQLERQPEANALAVSDDH
jgi:hypothetical protein